MSSEPTPNAFMSLAELVDGLINAARCAGEVDAMATDEDPQTMEDCEAVDEVVQAWRAALLARLTPTVAAPAMPTVALEPVQGVAIGMTPEASADAFNEVVRRYRLRSAAGMRLRRSVHFSAILLAAYREDWRTVNRLLGHANVID